MNPEPSTSSTSDETAGTPLASAAMSDPTSKTAEELSSNPPEQAGMTLHKEDGDRYVRGVKYYPWGHPKRGAYLEELGRVVLGDKPRPKFYAVQLAVDMKKMRNGVSKHDFVKEEAIRLLKGICGSSWEDKFVCVAGGNEFFCELFEDEAEILAGKEEVVRLELAFCENHPSKWFGSRNPPEQIKEEKALETAAEPSSIKEKDGMTLHKENGDRYVCGVKYFPKGHPKRGVYLQELRRAVLHREPCPKFYAVQLAVDMNKKRNGVSYLDFVKEEAIRLLKGICGSSWEDKFVCVAVGTVFFCELSEDEANIVAGKKEVVRLQLAPLDGSGVNCPLSDVPNGFREFYDNTMFQPCSSN